VICTHGKNGASLLTKNGTWLEQPVVPVAKIIDANGAGDSFFAAFLYGFMNAYSLKDCMQMGALAAALCIQSKELVASTISVDYLLSKM
jgi:acarbose 7IV-phosphotransferase